MGIAVRHRTPEINGCFYKLGGPFCGILKILALLLLVYSRALIFPKLPMFGSNGSYLMSTATAVCTA